MKKFLSFLLVAAMALSLVGVSALADEPVKIDMFYQSSRPMNEFTEMTRQKVIEDIGVDIQMGSVQEVYRWVQEGRVDMCFASRQESVALDWTPLKDDELFAILPPDYDNGGRSVFPVEDFDGREFLMPSMGFNLDIMRVLNRHGVTPLIRTTQVSDSVIISMVEHGLGVSMLSRLVLQGRQDDVQALPLAPRAVRELGIASRPRKELRPAVRRFIAEAREMIEKM